MKVELFSLCDFAQENAGKLTIVGTFDSILARDFPCIHPFLTVVLRLRFDLWEFGEHRFRVETRDLDGESLIEPLSGELKVRGAGNATSVSHITFSVSTVRLKSAGVINWVLYIDDKETAVLPLYVRKAP